MLIAIEILKYIYITEHSSIKKYEIKTKKPLIHAKCEGEGAENTNQNLTQEQKSDNCEKEKEPNMPRSQHIQDLSELNNK